jgi:hypothetical protein
MTMEVRLRPEAEHDLAESAAWFGFDSHRPLHFSLSVVSLRCLRARLTLSPSSHSIDAATRSSSFSMVSAASTRAFPSEAKQQRNRLSEQE